MVLAGLLLVESSAERATQRSNRAACVTAPSVGSRRGRETVQMGVGAGGYRQSVSWIAASCLLPSFHTHR